MPNPVVHKLRYETYTRVMEWTDDAGPELAIIKLPWSACGIPRKSGSWRWERVTCRKCLKVKRERVKNG